MNKVIMTGRLTADPENRQTQGGTPVATYRLAVDRIYKAEGQPEADFFTCVAWGKNAEFVGKYLRKGTKIAIEGELRSRQWEKDGQKHTATEIVVERHEFMESKAKGQTSDAGRYVGAMPEDLAGLDLPF